MATAEFDVSVREFYERFVADDAPYGLPDFHMSRGDWEVGLLCSSFFLAGRVRAFVPVLNDGDPRGGGKPFGMCARALCDHAELLDLRRRGIFSACFVTWVM